MILNHTKIYKLLGYHLTVENEEVLMSLKQSRKAFLVEYACGLFILGAFWWLNAQGLKLSRTLSYMIIGLGVIIIAIPELYRLTPRYKITTSKLIVIEGILKQQRKNVYYHPLGFVPDLNVSQTAVQRLLDYGSIFLRGSDQNTFEIRNINSPQEILAWLEELIDKNRRNKV